MRASALFAIPVILGLAVAAASAETPKDVRGLYLLTDYPAVSVRPGTTSTLSLRLQNYGLAPERFALSVEGVPQGWVATLLGGGQPVAAAMPAADANVPLQLRLDVPANAGLGTHNLTVSAAGQGNRVELPIAVTLAKELPAKLAVEATLPALRGTPKSSFDYSLKIKNDSGRNLTASFAAEAPRNFETSFTEAYGTQQLSSIPIEAGQSKEIKLKVRPPSTIDAGKYPISVAVSAEDATAKTALSLEVVGQPQLTISGRDGLVSGRAEAGAQSNIPVVVANTGSAPADNVELSATAPSGWKVTFEPKTIDMIAPGKDAEVQAQITPTAKSLAGDYMTTIRASSRGESATTQFRVAVSTSTAWGMAGAGIIGAALLLMVGAVSRFGRR
ncbi:NEW3 domain-containing protein [Xanthobacteraceae bacterium Astr-EGSB]|uniref:COG1470 family protein n=1 Tax=Astrobacterium formosum TaxID=3069710 RepID=UPI0027B5C705|nr:NEW3 domain-containing protein [Xanthobacteraceae bacterium Astr-EGSB]